MSGDADKAKAQTEEVPDLARHYRPVAIRSVLAAHAMIPRVREKALPEPFPDMSFSLPEGFHTVAED
ncbi:hypothetical protein PZN02_005362 [Sinorhizobium garamanticum]|uniref:Uncharacterized protein n=1 Tax=Sinorhizobium garamanticum TaxID=680247 RepID=A0ABY8DGJ4_9HYPH|nr:hypothetical protein [Sinorhizobium garamanticum]WEX90020.1 hypothetical protein PZN02_005362 [Sinorhizobium garamanticum]